MRNYALLRENIVVETRIMSDEEVLETSRSFQLVVDINDLVIPPQVGWILSGNQLTPAPGQQVALDQLINARIKFYQDQASTLMRDLYTANTLLGITLSQSDAMFDEYADVLIRIREGAWPTALYRLSQKSPSGFVTQEMINNWIARIQARMV